MAVAYTIPAQKVDGYDIPSTVFTVYTGDITVGSSEPMHFDNILLATVLLEPDTDIYIVLLASRTTFLASGSPSTYTYNGKTVYWTAFPWPPGNAITFSPDLPTNIKTANTEMDSIDRYAAWLMVYGGYIATFSELEETANAIRAKTGSSTAIEWEAGEGFKDAIAAIQTGVDGLKNALCFSSPSSFTLETFDNAAGWNGTIEWTDGTHAWAVWDGTTTLTASSGLLYLRGISNTVISADSNNKFILTGTNISCNGNIENLLDYATVALGNHPTMAASCYAYMFTDCTSLISAPELPATTLRNYCYQDMFFGCTNLISAPALPATTLAYSCYRSMFQNCTSLKSTPGLPATTLAGSCYYMMFKGCTNLISASVLPATTFGLNDDMCYAYMFMDCTSLTAAPELPATTISYGCYEYMFQNCTSLVSAPAKLPATTLTGSCYMGMFKGCTSLITPPALPATTLTTFCYLDMFYDCTALISLPLLPATTLATQCYDQMFRNCTNIKISSTYDSTNYPYAFRIPESGTATEVTASLISMFAGTGGTFTSDPTLNRVYYLSKSLPTDFTIDGDATAADILSGKISYANGSRVVGSIASKSSTDLTASGATVTAPAGYYSTAASKAVASGTQGTPSISVSSAGLITASCTDTTGYITGTTKSATQQMTARTSSDLTASGATVTAPAGYYNAAASKAIASGSAKPPASISGTSATVSTGTNTLTLSKTISVTPTVTAGYVSAGTAGNVSVSLTGSVTTKAAATITPTTSNQTIAAGTYLTGAQTIAGNANLVAGNIKSGVSIFGVTGSYAGQSLTYVNSITSTSQYSSSVSTLFPSNGTYLVFVGGGHWQTSNYDGGGGCLLYGWFTKSGTTYTKGAGKYFYGASGWSGISFSSGDTNEITVSSSSISFSSHIAGDSSATDKLAFNIISFRLE